VITLKKRKMKETNYPTINEAIDAVKRINKALDETNESGQVIYVSIETDGSEFEITYLGINMYHSLEKESHEGDLIEIIMNEMKDIHELISHDHKVFIEEFKIKP